ncbi:AzlD domain-containing protein [Oenococcus alcoholitolerans]|uniref:Branched-chain amino acid ABC transporter n=1 Tax=Oenococcus alcoholitolerans TaxID=931074 RepID=A0ABR4XRD8_9LACO|nr:branched-chain amino acid ABC transporter [Oenococcus alcoholitolerans]
MPSIKFIMLTIIGCGLVTWLSRILPLVVLKKFKIPKGLMEFLSFVPIAIMSGLWFQSLFIQHLGHMPEINYQNLLASLPTIAAAIISKNLLFVVVTGVISLGLINLLF